MSQVNGFDLSALVASLQTPPREQEEGEVSGGRPQRRSSAMQSNEQLGGLTSSGASPVSGGPTRSASPLRNESPGRLSSAPLPRSSLEILAPKPIRIRELDEVPEWLAPHLQPGLLKGHHRSDTGHSDTESVSPSES
jgi:hypothetical protein